MSTFYQKKAQLKRPKMKQENGYSRISEIQILYSMRLYFKYTEIDHCSLLQRGYTDFPNKQICTFERH